MPGYNHFSTCTCGWCLKRRGLSRRAKPKSKSRPTVNIDSVTVPNAICPVCGDKVYFYWNDAGSRVYFDDLGPPWPKHPCTDRPSGTKRLRVSSSSRAATTSPWRDAGWIPAIFERSKREEDWNVLYLTILETGEPLRVLTDVLKGPERGGLVYYQHWDEKFCTSLEFLDAYLSPERIWGWKYDKWFMTSMTKAVDDRRSQSVTSAPKRPPKKRRTKASRRTVRRKASRGEHRPRK